MKPTYWKVAAVAAVAVLILAYVFRDKLRGLVMSTGNPVDTSATEAEDSTGPTSAVAAGGAIAGLEALCGRAENPGVTPRQGTFALDSSLHDNPMYQLLPTITVDASGDLVKPATPMRFWEVVDEIGEATKEGRNVDLQIEVFASIENTNTETEVVLKLDKSSFIKWLQGLNAPLLGVDLSDIIATATVLLDAAPCFIYTHSGPEAQ